MPDARALCREHIAKNTDILVALEKQAAAAVVYSEGVVARAPNEHGHSSWRDITAELYCAPQRGVIRGDAIPVLAYKYNTGPLIDLLIWEGWKKVVAAEGLQ